MAYLERKDVEGAQEIYHQGDPADTLDLVAVGSLNIEVASTEGKRLGVRRVMTHTVKLRWIGRDDEAEKVLEHLTRCRFRPTETVIAGPWATD